MSALTSLLVRDQVVSVRKIEEAIQRQVISGGDLETVLLDMDAVSENVMSAYRAALYGLLPATRDEVMKIPRDILKLVPREVAEQYRLVPLSAEGRTLVVAVTTPLDADTDEQLAFLLGHDLVYRVVSEVRLAAALAHHYGVDITARLRRVADKLRSRQAGPVPYVAPPKDAKLDRLGEIPSKHELVDWGDDEREGEPTATEGTGTRKHGIPPEATPDDGAEGEVDVARSLVIEGGARAPSSRPPPPSAEPSPASRRRAPAPTPPARPSSKPPAGSGPSTLARKLRGPLTTRTVIELLSEATDRDQILEILFTFARQFFDYTALFVVHGDIAEGKDAFGPGASPGAVERIAVPLDVPGTFAEVRRTTGPAVVDLRRDELDAIVARDLDRAAAQPAVVAPVTIRGRAVLLLYGDRGGERFTIGDLPELMAVLPRVGEAFQELILRRKYRGYGEARAEDRSALKSAAGRASGVDLTAEAGRAGAYRPSSPPAEGEVGAGNAPQWGAGPGARKGRRRKRSEPLDVLRVPRSAPPPPMPEGAAHGAEGTELKKTRPDGAAAKAVVAARGGAVGKPTVEMSAPAGDEPEVTIEYDAEERDSVEPSSEERVRPVSDRPIGGGAYVLHQASTDVVAPVRARSDRPPSHGPNKPPTDRPPRRSSRIPGSRSYRPDPRRDDDSLSVTHDVVRVPTRTARDTPPERPRADAPVERTSEPEVQTSQIPSTPSPDEPSVIVDMGDSVESLVDDLVRSGPEDESAAVQSLLHLGEAALPALIQRFPGPLWFDRHTPHRRLPRGRDVSAVARALHAFGDVARPYVASLLSSHDPDVRFYAALLSSEMVGEELLHPLADRIFDEDPGTRLLVLDVLRLFNKWPKEMEEILKGVRVEAKVTRKNRERRLVAIRALGELRDVRSLGLLVELLASEEEDVVTAAQRSLVLLTRQDFGDSQRKWLHWAEKNQTRHRIEWLIDGLLHPDEGIRDASAEELKVLTQEYYGYHPASPKRDREIAQRKYRSWWEAEGRRRFVG